MTKDTAFRIWLMKIWTENRDEHQEFKGSFKYTTDNVWERVNGD